MGSCCMSFLLFTNASDRSRRSVGRGIDVGLNNSKGVGVFPLRREVIAFGKWKLSIKRHTSRLPLVARSLHART
jgi:hypothetical protein